MKKYIPPILTASVLLTYFAFGQGTEGTNGTKGTAESGAEPRPFSHPDRIKYDSECFTIDGKDVFIFSGSFHYFRCPKELWPARFQAIKDAGFNAVETYTAWNYHEPEMPDSVNDFSKLTNMQEIDDWLTMAEKYGLYVIIRPGPYICAEWSNGGFPRWMSVLEKPAKALRPQGWVRSDDPAYLAWCKHWYDAVCPIIAKHQITRKAPGEPGVILFQIENEYDFWKLPDGPKINYLTALANDAVADGIDVPLVSCWTKQIRGIKSGPLRGVFDCTNLYPRLKVEHDAGEAIKKLRAEQPDAPLATTELQGGWFAEVGGKLSEQQPGLSPAEIQNLTLYVWQMGDTFTNYYMVFGGTNFGDWAGGKNITSYDYDAPIREDGGVGPRYQRVQALGEMIREHGANLARAEAVEITGSASDKDVELAERQAKDGSRYIFVRTENNTDARAGSATVTEKDGTKLAFDYKLEPFGAMVLYLAPGVTDAKQGEWLPKPAPDLVHPSSIPAPVVIGNAERSEEALAPLRWEPLKAGAPVETLGIYGSHYFFYKITAKPGAMVTAQMPKGDGIIATANGKLLKETVDKKSGRVTFSLPPDAGEMVALYENLGHPNFGPAMGQPFGIVNLQGADGAMEIAKGTADMTEEEYGDALTLVGNAFSTHGETIPIGKDSPAAPDALLTWYRMHFELPDKGAGIAAPWHLHVEANGNGFIYINGHCLGRYWQAGPQYDYFIPDNWLNFGPGTRGMAAPNAIVLDLRPVDKGVSLQSAVVAPDAAFAVESPLPAQ
jgi:hypothetical protein